MTLKPGKLVLVCCWQIVFYGTLTFLAVLQAKTSLLVPDGCFSMMSTKWTALEDRDCVSVWSKGQACLLTIKRCSGSLKFGVPVCKCGCYFLSPWTFYIILWKRNKQKKTQNQRNKSPHCLSWLLLIPWVPKSFLWPRRFVSSATICRTLIGYQSSLQDFIVFVLALNEYNRFDLYIYIYTHIHIYIIHRILLIRK